MEKNFIILQQEFNKKEEKKQNNNPDYINTLRNFESKIFKRIDNFEETAKNMRDDLIEIKKDHLITTGKNEISNKNIEKFKSEFEKIELKINENFSKNIKEQENLRKILLEFELNTKEKEIDFEKKLDE